MHPSLEPKHIVINCRTGDITGHDSVEEAQAAARLHAIESHEIDPDTYPHPDA